MEGFRALVRHFLGSFIGRGVLQEDGVEAARGVLFGVVALFISIGFILPRHFHRIYLELAAFASPEPFQRALAADGLFMLTLPFIVAMGVAALVAPAMFPDDVDYQTLVPLPITRRRIFLAKLTALAILVGSLMATLSLFSAMSFTLFTHQRWAQGHFMARIAAHTLASSGSAALGFGLVVAIQGVATTWAPRSWRPRLSVFVPSAIITAVVLAVPFVLQLPAQRDWIATEPGVLALFPPAWFLGLERVTLGTASPYWRHLASLSVVGIAGIAAVGSLAYYTLYRHFERLVLPSPRSTATGLPRRTRPAAMDAWPFTVVTLVRNRMPLLIFLVFLALGAGVVILSGLTALLDVEFRWDEPPSSRLVGAAIAAPLVLMLAGLAGLRTAFQLPVHSRANWIFRISDSAAMRARQFSAIDRACLRLVVVPSIGLVVPVQLWLLRGDALVPIVLTMLVGMAMIEVALIGWRRVPFTCTWIPGKRPLVFTLIGAIVLFGLVTTLLAPLIRLAMVSWAVAFGFAGVMVTTATVLRQYRVRLWRTQSLQFEDESVNKIQTLQLN